MSKILVKKTPSSEFTLNRTEINQNFQCAMLARAGAAAERLPRQPQGRHLDQKFGPSQPVALAAVALALSVVR